MAHKGLNDYTPVTPVTEIPKGKVDPAKLTALKDARKYFVRRSGTNLKQIRPTDNPTRFLLFSGGLNGMCRCGTFEVSTDSNAYYSCASWDTGVQHPPMALVEWGYVLSEFVLSLMPEQEPCTHAWEQHTTITEPDAGTIKKLYRCTKCGAKDKRVSSMCHYNLEFGKDYDAAGACTTCKDKHYDCWMACKQA